MYRKAFWRHGRRLVAYRVFAFNAAETGGKRKPRWRLTLAGAPLFWIAGPVHDDAFAMLTAALGADIASYHDRRIVVLRPEDGAAWLLFQRSDVIC